MARRLASEGGCTTGEIAVALGVSRGEAYRLLRLASIPAVHGYVGSQLPASAAWQLANLDPHKLQGVLRRLERGQRLSIRDIQALVGHPEPAAPEDPKRETGVTSGRSDVGFEAGEYYHMILAPGQAADLLEDLPESPQTPVGQRLRIELVAWLQANGHRNA